MPKESTIQIFRSNSTVVPTGLTFGELALSDVAGVQRLYVGVNHGSTGSIWIGAGVTIGDITNNSTGLVPTQSAVKAYVDGIVGAGSGVVNTINGTGGAITITGATDGPVNVSQLGGKGITLSVWPALPPNQNRVLGLSIPGPRAGVASFDSSHFTVSSLTGHVSLTAGVAFTNASNTWSATQSFPPGITGTGLTFTNGRFNTTLNVGGRLIADSITANYLTIDIGLTTNNFYATTSNINEAKASYIEGAGTFPSTQLSLGLNADLDNPTNLVTIGDYDPQSATTLSNGAYISVSNGGTAQNWNPAPEGATGVIQIFARAGTVIGGGVLTITGGASASSLWVSAGSTFGPVSIRTGGISVTGGIAGSIVTPAQTSITSLGTQTVFNTAGITSSERVTISSGGLVVNGGGISVTGGANLTGGVTIAGPFTVQGGIPNGQLQNSSVTVVGGASSTLSLGGTLTLTGIGNNIVVSNSSNTLTLSLADDIVIPGNLTVNGTVVTANVSTFEVEDSLFMLGTGNAADTVDLGFYSQYTPVDGKRFTGLFRDATDGKYNLFTNLTGGAEPTTTVNIAGAGYTIATLIARIDGGTF